MIMSPTIIVMSIVIALLIAGFAAYLFWAQRKFEELEAKAEKGKANTALPLGAYERLTLFVERMKINNLANRVSVNGLSAKDLQQILTATIREEYDHNITQQLYVKKEIWEAVTKMKEQNTYIINQLFQSLPPNSSGLDLSRRMVEFGVNNAEATLNHLVLDALQYEVKQLL